ncbi:hypothetical protein [Tahibacter harae]|uniref:EF-hand domain-containing protein n=1 Tax=Tahibacter harae TaxID=2963937 RepID=A0ABT1QR31_9GAMM|nr:hypothetical protein [Tahibacter harae]MCQ4164717.1 hypothetical protein [Tahibacter harae]
MKMPILAVLLLLAGSACAQNSNNPTANNPNNPTDRSGMNMPSFDSVDTNRDGSVSQAEFDAAKVRNMTLAQVDQNSDGMVSRDEWNKHSDKPERR